MKNYIAIDSGGTKVIAVLYDEYFRPKAISRVGSFRANTTPPEQIQKNMKRLIMELGLTPGTVIHQISGITTEEFVSFVSDTCEVLQVDLLGELSAGLCAAGIFGDGIQALSGTGSNSAAHFQGKNYFAGGYGANISDIGSGFWIGREALKSAIADFEGYGSHTILTEMLSAHLGGNRDSFREAIFSIYNNDMSSISSQVAACSQVVSRAAEQGDSTAIGILQSAGKLLAKQTIALIKKHHIPDYVPLTVSGNVWRSHYAFMSSFMKDILEQSTERPIKLPMFEPIVGVIIKHYHDLNCVFTHEMQACFRTLYPQYVIDYLRVQEVTLCGNNARSNKEMPSC